MKSTCLRYALDKWHEEGGRICFVKSKHWFIPHAQHESQAGVLTQFVPFENLKQPWYSLFSFEGHVITGDSLVREPISKTGMLIGIVLLLISGAAWAIKHTYNNYDKKNNS
jgi:hypothetical protein